MLSGQEIRPSPIDARQGSYLDMLQDLDMLKNLLPKAQLDTFNREVDKGEMTPRVQWLWCRHTLARAGHPEQALDNEEMEGLANYLSQQAG